MAKSSSGKPGGTSRIRFILVDAEIADGDIHSVTQAITNALRGPAGSPPVRRLAPMAPATNGGAAESEEIEGEFEESHEDEVIDAAPNLARSRAPRKAPKAPDIVEIEMNEGVSLAAFTQSKDSKSQNKKYLIAAAWLKEHRNIDAVREDHIYTCFRSIGWPTNILDFAQPLRVLKFKKYFTNPEKGIYAINHIGLDYVKKLGAE